MDGDNIILEHEFDLPYITKGQTREELDKMLDALGNRIEAVACEKIIDMKGDLDNAGN